jgi:hypothetical protein
MEPPDYVIRLTNIDIILDKAAYCINENHLEKIDFVKSIWKPENSGFHK